MRKFLCLASRLSALAIVGAVSLTAAPAGAVVIATTFGPGDSYDASIGYPIGSETLQEIAVGFVPGFDSALDSIRLATKHLAGANNYTVYLASDSGGSPGGALETFSSLAFTSPDSILTLNSLLNPTLSAGSTYWIVVSAPDLSGSYGEWNWNDQGFFGLAFQNAGTGWKSDDNPTPAFEVNASRTTSVPEPTTLLLFGAGFVGFTALRRRRAKAQQS
jgi:hypothetical protein